MGGLTALVFMGPTRADKPPMAPRRLLQRAASRWPGFGSPWYLIETGMATAHTPRPTAIIFLLNDCTYLAAWSAGIVPFSAGSTAVADGGTSFASCGSQSAKAHSQTRYWGVLGLSESLISGSSPIFPRPLGSLAFVAGFARIQMDFRSRAEFLRIRLQLCPNRQISSLRA